MEREIRNIKTRDFWNHYPSSNIVEAVTEYNTAIEYKLPNLLSFINTNNIGLHNNIPFIENELLMDFQNYPREIFFYLNENEELIGYGEDINYYSINEDNELIYNNPNT